ncbi:MAG: DNA alkylation repair protein [Lachnospiraceae bacterium]|nr:DNA alkylation repair protein [Lachnospiraceae bacterium]
MTKAEIYKRLKDLQDTKYRQMQQKIIPTVPAESIIGVRTPELKMLAKEMIKSGGHQAFLKHLPHTHFEENQLHAFILSELKDPDACMDELIKFLPYVDNWATCDQMSPKIFKKHKQMLLAHIKDWLKSEQTYTVRFGVGMLMQHFLDEDYDPRYPEMVAKLRSDEYYVNMMIAWYFATALAKQYESVLPFIEEKRLDTWTHNKAIQKSVESRRITDAQKQYLRSLKAARKEGEGDALQKFSNSGLFTRMGGAFHDKGEAGRRV